MHVLLLLANSHAFRLRTHYFNRLLARVRGPADYKSAIQQIANLRYVTVFASLRT